MNPYKMFSRLHNLLLALLIFLSSTGLQGHIDTSFNEQGIDITGSQFNCNTIPVHALDKDININPTHETSSYSSHTTTTDDGIFFSSTTQSQYQRNTTTSVPSRFNFSQLATLQTSGNNSVNLTHALFDVPLTKIITRNLLLKVGANTEEISQVTTSSDFLWNSIEVDKRLNINYLPPQFRALEVTAPENETEKPIVHVETVCGAKPLDYITNLQAQQTIEFIEKTLHNIRKHEHESHSSLSMEFCTMIGLGVSAVMPGFGNGLTAIFLKAVLNPMIIKSIISLANTGNLQQAFSRENLRSLATTVIATALIGSANAPESANLFEQGIFSLTQNVARNTLQAGLQTTIEKRGKFGDNFVQGLKASTINSVSTLATRGVGGLVHSVGVLNPFLQYGAHFLIGATTAQLSDADPIMGGLAAMAGEFAGECSFDWVKNSNSQEQLWARKEKAIEVTQFVIGLGAFLSGQKSQDIQMAAQTGGTAMRYNGLLDAWLLEQYEEYKIKLKKLAEYFRGERAPRGESFALEKIGSAVQKTSGQYWRNGEITPEVQQTMRFDPMGSAGTMVALMHMLQEGGVLLGKLGDKLDSTRLYYDQPRNHINGLDFFSGTFLIPIGFDLWDVVKAGFALSIERTATTYGASPSVAQDLSDFIDPLMFMGGIGAIGKMGRFSSVGKMPMLKTSNALVSVGNLPKTSIYPYVKSDGVILHPRVRLIGGHIPKNSHFAGTIYPLEQLPKELRQIYPHSIPFTGTGYPDFSRYAIKKVEIDFTGSTPKDFMLANKLAGLKTCPKDYTWHHSHDGRTMLLIPRELHKVVKHSGGMSIYRSKNK